jgi:uncharacterized protein (TIGR02145 family)
MAQNLDYQGDDGNLGKCYEDKPENCKKYGRLYNWSTAMNIDAKFNKEKWDSSAVKHQGICPKGWHLPEDAEWGTLVNFAGGEDVAGKKLKAKSGWNVPPTLVDKNRAINTDSYKFSALPGGKYEMNYRDEGRWLEVGDRGYWWSASEREERNTEHAAYEDKAYNWSMMYDALAGGSPNNYKSELYSVRCVKD